MNYYGIIAIFKFEMNRALRTIGQTIASPVISTILYFIVFGSTMGNRIGCIEGVDYGAFILPGLIMLTILGQSIANASFGIYFPRYSGTIYEILSAPLSPLEVVVSYVSAAATKSIIIGLIVLGTASLLISFRIDHPFYMICFLLVTSFTFSLLGFIIGLWADGFDKLQIFPLLIITPLTFLGGVFYSINMLPPIWHKISLINPVVYLVSGFRWSFYSKSDVSPITSIVVIMIFIIILLSIVLWMLRTGYRIKK